MEKFFFKFSCIRITKIILIIILYSISVNVNTQAAKPPISKPTYSNYVSFGLGYGDANLIDFIRWLIMMAYCTEGKTCAIANYYSCDYAKDNNITRENIFSTSLTIQSHRASPAFATYVLTSTGDFVDLAQENNEVFSSLYKPDGSKTFPDNKMIIASSITAAGSNWSQKGCLPFDQAGIFPCSNTTNEDFAFCLDISEAYNKSIDSCGIYAVQIASMVTQAELHQRIINKAINDTLTDFKHIANDFLNYDLAGCFQNSTSAAAYVCHMAQKYNSSEFIECVEAVEVYNCLNYVTIFTDIQNLLFTKNKHNTTINTNSSSFLSEIADALIQFVDLGAQILLYGGYINYNNYNNNNNSMHENKMENLCVSSITSLTGFCALSDIEIVKLFNITVTKIDSLNGKGIAALQQSIFYNGVCDNGTSTDQCVLQIISRRKAPTEFINHIGKTNINNNNVMRDFSKKTKVAQCILSELQKLGVCDFSSDKERTKEIGVFKNKIPWVDCLSDPQPVPEEVLPGVFTELKETLSLKRSKLKQEMSRIQELQRIEQEYGLRKPTKQKLDSLNLQWLHTLNKSMLVLSDSAGNSSVLFPVGQDSLRFMISHSIEEKILNDSKLRTYLEKQIQIVENEVIDSLEKLNKLNEFSIDDEIAKINQYFKNEMEVDQLRGVEIPEDVFLYLVNTYANLSESASDLTGPAGVLNNNGATPKAPDFNVNIPDPIIEPNPVVGEVPIIEIPI